MSKRIFLVFTDTNAVTLTNPENVPKGAIIDPELGHMRDVKREFWKFVDGKVAEMSPGEKRARLALIKKMGSGSKLTHRPTFFQKYWLPITIGIATFIAGWLSA